MHMRTWHASQTGSTLYTMNAYYETKPFRYELLIVAWLINLCFTHFISTLYLMLILRVGVQLSKKPEDYTFLDLKG